MKLRRLRRRWAVAIVDATTGEGHVIPVFRYWTREEAELAAARSNLTYDEVLGQDGYYYEAVSLW